ncbi:uncharacterized protein LOC117302368 [Asterias rubens]|uniref:uncharacterized protein LOC117302368 n=1 Tax=Asterias rubens TaxID=7604 RepID=UPI00145558A6|nr:uncharacterized protein LOC117302368 [Asterias rubens]
MSSTPQKDYGTMTSSSEHAGRHWSDSEPINDPPTTFADLGVIREAATVQTFFGKRRPLSSLTHKEWAFAVISILSILGAAALTIERIVFYVENPTSDVTFAIVLLLTLGFCLLYVVNGLFGERPYELLIFIIGTVILMIYSISNYMQTVARLDLYEKKIKMARLILIAAAGPVNIILGAVIAREYYISRNLIFRTVGANVDLQNLCSKIFFTESLFKIDLQLELSLVILVLKEGFNDVNALDIVVLAAGTLYALVWFLNGLFAMRLENSVMMYLLWIFSIFEPAYIVYKIVDLGKEWSHPDYYQNIRAAIILGGACGLFIRCSLIGCTIYVYRNFGKGMKEKAYGEFTSKPDETHSRTVET